MQHEKRSTEGTTTRGLVQEERIRPSLGKSRIRYLYSVGGDQ